MIVAGIVGYFATLGLCVLAWLQGYGPGRTAGANVWLSNSRHDNGKHFLFTDTLYWFSATRASKDEDVLVRSFCRS